MKDASVVICTRNQASRLRLVLRALAVQTVAPREVIVVDDASSDETPSVLSELRRHFTCELRVIRNVRAHGSPGARNIGAAAARGDLLVFIDGDAVPTKQHVGTHLEFHARYGRTLAAGALWHVTTTEYFHDPTTGELFDVPIPEDVQRRIDRGRMDMLVTEHDVTDDFAGLVARSAPGGYPGLEFMEAEGARLAEGAGHPAAWVLMAPQNASVPRADFERVGGFDSAIPFCEGWDLALRLRAADVATRRLGTAPTYHLFHHRRFADFEQRLRRWEAMEIISRKLGRRAELLGLLWFNICGGDALIPSEAGYFDLDALAERMARHGGGLGPYEQLLRGHPLLSELEEHVALGRRTPAPTPSMQATRPRGPSPSSPIGAFERVAGPSRALAEGPVWDGERVLFSDIVDSVIRKFDPQTRSSDVHIRRTFGGNGLALDPSGRLLVCEGGTPWGGRRVVRYEPDGGRTPLATHYRGRRLNAPNDIVVDALGRIWVSDPCYGDRMTMELLHESVYRLDPTPGGDYVIHRATRDTVRPNGVALSRDQRTLYVAESPLPPEPRIELRAYPIDDRGELGPHRVLHDFGCGRGVDGMAIDRDDNIVATAGWARGGAGPRIVVFDPNGNVVTEESLPAEPTNCCFAESGSALYVTTADGCLYRAPTEFVGLGFAGTHEGSRRAS